MFGLTDLAWSSLKLTMPGHAMSSVRIDCFAHADPRLKEVDLTNKLARCFI
jgi:hypothetical protein